mgnify:CR=1 FL=1
MSNISITPLAEGLSFGNRVDGVTWDNIDNEDLRAQLKSNMELFRSGLEAAGFDLLPGEHPIIPVMLHDAQRAQDCAAALLDAGVYVTGFSFPVVPKGQARIRTQVSAALTTEQIDNAIDAFARVGRELEIIP